MSPILDLQRRLAEVGRIRLGTTVEATSRAGKQYRRPVKLETWRLTSKDEQRIRAAAELYGGAPAPWRDGEWEIVTDSPVLDVLVIPGQALSQWWEMWGQPAGNGAVSCLRRCDGETELLSGGRCQCPADYDERRDQAKDGRACKPTTRLSVVLPRLPGIGQWRLEAHGFYAAVELAAAAGVLEEASRRGALLPARLRIETRSRAQDGQTVTWPVPVLDLDVSLVQLRELAAGAAAGEIVAAGRLALPVGTLDRPAGVSVSEGLEAAAQEGTKPRRQGRQSAPVGPAAPVPAGEPIPVEEPAESPVPPVASDAQRRLLHATRSQLGLSEDELKDVLEAVTGQRSTRGLPAALVDQVLDRMRQTAAAANATSEPSELFPIPAGARHEDRG